jgi:hypothetical protein
MDNLRNRGIDMLYALKSLPLFELIPAEANCSYCSRQTFQGCVNDNPNKETVPDSAICRIKRLADYLLTHNRQN